MECLCTRLKGGRTYSGVCGIEVQRDRGTGVKVSLNTGNSPELLNQILYFPGWREMLKRRDPTFHTYSTLVLARAQGKVA